jgi:hypothetical protein
VKVLHVWVRGDGLVRVEAMFRKHGEVAAKYDDWEELGVEENPPDRKTV